MLLIAGPLLAAGAVLPPGTDRLTLMQPITWLAFHTCLLATAPMLYLRWRITHESAIAWLTTVVLAVAAAGLPLAIVDVASGDRPGSSSQLAAVFLLGPAIVMNRHAARGVQFRPAHHPLILGLALGLCALAVHVTRSLALPGQALVTPRPWVLPVAIGVGAIALALVVTPVFGHGRVGSHPWPVAVFAASTLTATLLPPSSPSMGAVATWSAMWLLLALSAGAVDAATRLLLEALGDQAGAVAPAPSATAVPRPRRPRDEEVFHEVRATVADITNASRLLIDHAHELPPDRRHRLETMLDLEMRRLGRLVSEEPGAIGPVKLDDVVAPLVLAQATQGRTVRWQPSGLVVSARRDELTEIAHVLLTNARCHGGGTITVSATCTGRLVHLIVSDEGPGIDARLLPMLFQRGTRGPDSAGQGLGLHVAHRLAREQGGRLWLAANDRPGATFVVSLRAQEHSLNRMETS